MILQGRLGVWVAMGVALAGCTSSPPPPPVLADIGARCLAGLDQRSIRYDRMADFTTPEGCGVSQAVRIKQSALAWNRPALMSCSLAATIWEFETRVVQPAAQRHFGQAARKLSHAGSYSCRGEIGGRAERISQHGYGRAIDVTGFELADGTVISVLRDWRGKGEKSAFLLDVAKGACTIFNLVLTPNHNAEHHDHLHLDIGPNKMCGV